MAKKPREKLRELRQRAGLSGTDMSKMLGYATPTGYLRYEQEAHMKDKPIPFEIVKALLPHFRGRGTPAITTEEVMGLTDTREVPPQVQQAFVGVVTDGEGLLVVRYRVEPGVFVRSSVVKSYGAAKIGVSTMFPSSQQYVAAVTSDHGGLKAGTQLHCVEPGAFSSIPHGRRVLVGVRESAGSDLVEVCVGRIGNDGTAYSSDGMPLDGDVLGVVIGSYSPE